MWLTVCILIFWIGVGLGLTTMMNRGDFEYDSDDVNFKSISQRDFKGRLRKAYQTDPFECIEIIAVTVTFWPLILYLIINGDM